MTDYSNKDIIRSIISIPAGVIVAVIIVIPFGIVSALLTFSDAHIPKLQEYFAYCLLTIGIALGSFLGGCTVVKISKRESYIFVILCGIVLAFLDFVMNDFDLSMYDLPETIFLLTIMPFMLLGGWMEIKKQKARHPNNLSSPSDTAEQ